MNFAEVKYSAVLFFKMSAKARLLCDVIVYLQTIQNNQFVCSAAVALLLARWPPVETTQVRISAAAGKKRFISRAEHKHTGQGKGWVRLILLHGPAVGGCDMEGYPLRYAWFAVVSLYTTPQELPFFIRITSCRNNSEKNALF
jgi:hypothetical protein